jgi:hypothetical protein
VYPITNFSLLVLTFPCLRTVKEERVVWTEHERYLGHRIACRKKLLARVGILKLRPSARPDLRRWVARLTAGFVVATPGLGAVK